MIHALLAEPDQAFEWRLAAVVTKSPSHRLTPALTSGEGFTPAVLRSLTGNSTAARDVLGHTTTRVTEDSYEHRLPEGALRGMKLFEAKVTAEN